MKPPAEAGAQRPIRWLLTTDAGLTFFLISLFLLLFVFYPLSEPKTFRQYLVDAFAMLVMISGVYAVSDRRRLLLWSVIVLALFSLTMQVMPYAYLNRTVLVLNNASTMLFMATVAGAVLYRVLRKGSVTSHRIQGAVAVYLMIGLIWAKAYSIAYILDPSSFDLGDVIGGREDLIGINTSGMIRLIYFSFVTMTTLGYGDIAPQSEFAYNLAILQALVGQLYLVVILARLVSLAVTSPDRE
jgi:hypothetical protein